MSRFDRTLRVGVLGGGAMATALVGGLLSSHLVQPSQIMISEIDASQRLRLQGEASLQGVAIVDDNPQIARTSHIIVLAVKPHVVAPLLDSLRLHWTHQHQRSPASTSPSSVSAPLPSPSDAPLLISIASGITLHTLADLVPPFTPIVRVVPNTPALCRAGISALCANKHCSLQQIDMCSQLFQSVGDTISLDEALLDAVTGLSGSGPAFVFLVLEAMSDGGVRAGLPRAIANKLAISTVRGAASLAQHTQTPFGALKDSVASPNGTTIRGLHELERAGIRGAFISAVIAAAERSVQMGTAQPQPISKL